MRRVARTSRADIGLGPTQTSKRFGRRPGALDGVLLAIVDHLRVDPLRRAPQRQLAQGNQMPLLEKVVDRPPGLLGHVHLAFAQPFDQVVGRDVDQLDFVGLVEHAVGHRFADLHVRDLRDHVIEAFQMLHVERRINVDAGVEQILGRPASAWRASCPARWYGPARRPGSTAAAWPGPPPDRTRRSFVPR